MSETREEYEQRKEQGIEKMREQRQNEVDIEIARKNIAKYQQLLAEHERVLVALLQVKEAIE